VSRVERLLKAYERFVSLPWDAGIAGPQKVWFAVYDPVDERRLRVRVDEFEIATKQAGHGWVLKDLTEEFPRWMAGQDYRESYFEDPEDLELALPRFREAVVGSLRDVLAGAEADENAVVAVTGIASLFGFAKVSDVVRGVADSIRGRLLVFFPGSHEGNNYRLLDARDGWNYLAVPISAGDGMESR
jgi:hypothetical protein